MDYYIITMLTFMALCAVVGAYAVGFVRGYDECREEHRWHRWLVRREENRRTKL